ncbi:MAG: hypothetical protein ACXWSR_19675 [Bdellovibrionota bacterium]
MSELLDEIAGESVQVEVSAVRILFELLGFLLKQLSAISHTQYTLRSRFVLLSETGWAQDISASFRLQ